MALFGFVVYYRNGGEEFAIALGETQEEAAAAVSEAFRVFAVKDIQPLHIEDTLGDHFSGVARCSTARGWRFSEAQCGGHDNAT